MSIEMNTFGAPSMYRVPPDSSGKRIATRRFWHISYVNGTVDISKGDIITDPVSGAKAKVAVLDSTNTTANGQIIVVPEADSAAAEWTPGGDLNVNGSKVAEVAATNGYQDAHAPVFMLAGGNNPHSAQFVDDEGQAFVRFAEGAPQFDAFGKLSTAEQTVIREYVHMYDELPSDFSTVTVGGATLSHEPQHAGVLLSCTTAAGDDVSHISDLYHKYQPGQSQTLEMTIAVGDTGKANVERHWGYGDNTDGAFFKLDGTTLSVAMSSSTIAGMNVPQSNWNQDKLDGTGLSGITLDVSKDNIYWMDIQWLGAGRVRFGVVIQGKRITCHEMYHANKFNVSYMRTASLPIYVHQKNHGASASTSELRFFCATVKTGGKFRPQRSSFSMPGTSFATINSTTPTPLMTGRSMQTFKGVENRVWTMPTGMCIHVVGDPIIIQVIKSGSLTGATFAVTPNADSAMEVDDAATAISGGRALRSRVVMAGVLHVDLRDLFSTDGEIITRKADIAAPPDHYTITAANLEGAKSSQVLIGMDWDEIL